MTKSNELFIGIKVMPANKVPKIFNAYWDGAPLSYLGYLTIETCLFYNPGWEVRIYTPIKRSTWISWSTHEQKSEYTGEDYWYRLKANERLELNVRVIEVDFEQIGFSNEAPEVIKSDYLRYHLMATDGGIWSDMDILYIASLEDTVFNPNFGTQDFDTLLVRSEKFDGYWTIAFLMSTGVNEFFSHLHEMSKGCYCPDRYQCIGANMLNDAYPTPESLVNSMPEHRFRIDNTDLYLCFECDQLDDLFVRDCTDRIPAGAVGVHWFNGSTKAKDYLNRSAHGEAGNCTISTLVRTFEKWVSCSSGLRRFP
ncbi:MAG: glycosyltransferase family 32 protein [Sulfobacillus sp.]